MNARWLFVAPLCAAVLSVGAATAAAEDATVEHGCQGTDCGTTFTGGPGDNAMTVEPSDDGRVQFTEGSEDGSIDTEDAADGCVLSDDTTAVCLLATGAGESSVDGSDGDDTVTLMAGETGVSKVYGNAGNDEIHANDGNVQTVIDCDGPDAATAGGDADVAHVDADDPEPVGCETVERADSDEESEDDESEEECEEDCEEEEDTTAPAIAARPKGPAVADKRGRFAFAFGAFKEAASGTVAIKSAPFKPRAGKRVKKVAIKLAPKKFRAQADKRVRVRFKLTGKQRRWLTRVKAVRMTATVKARDAAGNASTRKFTFKLKPRRARG